MVRDEKSWLVDYVCADCFNTLENCTCKNRPMKKVIIAVDKNIQEHVRILNQKGYITLDCCESHNKHGNMYISFTSDYGFGTALPLPNGFKKLKKCAVSIMYKKNISDEEFSSKKKEYLDTLLEWCNNLPDNRTF